MATTLQAANTTVANHGGWFDRKNRRMMAITAVAGLAAMFALMAPGAGSDQSSADGSTDQTVEVQL